MYLFPSHLPHTYRPTPMHTHITEWMNEWICFLGAFLEITRKCSANSTKSFLLCVPGIIITLGLTILQLGVQDSRWPTHCSCINQKKGDSLGKCSPPHAGSKKGQQVRKCFFLQLSSTFVKYAKCKTKCQDSGLIQCSFYSWQLLHNSLECSLS